MFLIPRRNPFLTRFQLGSKQRRYALCSEQLKRGVEKARTRSKILSPHPPRAAVIDAIRRGMKSNRFCKSVFGREFHIARMRSKRMRIMIEPPANHIPHVINRRHIRRISSPRKNLHVLG
ncbi:hypothetical protein TNCV_5116381 [Trichonephila clavipes]|nr:hypothetical protein TNCV_5116381 [Trichonephila clavipes]